METYYNAWLKTICKNDLHTQLGLNEDPLWLLWDMPMFLHQPLSQHFSKFLLLPMNIHLQDMLCSERNWWEGVREEESKPYNWDRKWSDKWI